MSHRSYTIYAYMGKRMTKVPLLTFEGTISDWFYIKSLLIEAMKLYYLRYEKTEALLSLERHKKGGGWFTGFSRGKYLPARIHYGREYEAFFRVVFHPVTERIEVKRAVFSWELREAREGYYRMEKGIEYKPKPVIPKNYTVELSPLALLREMSGLRYVDYSRKPQSPWADPELTYKVLVMKNRYYKA